jgi:hypothetical protein
VSELVPTEKIERIVGAKRDAIQHLGRAVSMERYVYILHSQFCKDSGIDLRDCDYSAALGQGIDPDDWNGYEDRAVVLLINRGTLFPVVPSWLGAGA